MDDACPLAALAALSFDEHQLEKAEWYTEYPQLPLAISDHAMRQAKELSPPPPPPDTADYSGPVKAMLKLMDAQAFSTFAAITCGHLGGLWAAMDMIAGIVRVEIDWQLFVMQPLSSLNAVATSRRPAASEQRRPQPASRSDISAPAIARVRAGANANAAIPGVRVQRDHRHHQGKRKRSMAEVFEAETEAERQPPRPLPEKRMRYSPSRGNGSHYPASPRISTALEGKGGGLGQERVAPCRPPTPRPRPEPRPEPRPAPTLIEAAPYCCLWNRLGGRNVSSWSYNDNHDDDRGRAPRRRL